MWIIIIFYNIIIKSAGVDKGGGGKTLIHKMRIKIVFFLTLPIAGVQYIICHRPLVFNLPVCQAKSVPRHRPILSIFKPQGGFLKKQKPQ